MLCEEHSEQNVIAFCEDCDILVCYDCITDTHKRHEFKKLAKVAEEKRQKILIEILSEKESILQDLREFYEELEVSKKEGLKLEENIIKDIQDRAEKMKTHIECIKNERVSKVRGLFQPQRDALDRKTTSINEATKTLTKLSDEKESLQSKPDIEIIQLYMCINKQLEEIRNKSKISLIEGEFLCGGDFETNLEKIFGSFENENETSSDDLDLPRPVEIKPRKLECVVIGLTGTIQSLHLTGEDSGWILCNSSLYFANSISMKKYTEKAKNVESFAVSKEGEVYFVTSSSVVKKINTDDTVTKWCDMAPYKPKYILLQKPDGIRVFLWSEDDKRYFILKFDKIGRKLEKKNFETVRKKIYKLAENEFGDFCIKYNSNKPHIVTVDVNLSTFYFGGVLGATPSQNYYISDFCYVSKGRIVVLDIINNAVYLLDRKCSFIKLLTSIDEIKSPEHVSLDQFDRLWISSSSGTYILSNWDQ